MRRAARWRPLMESVQRTGAAGRAVNANDVLAFLVELAALAVLCAWGLQAGGSTAARFGVLAFGPAVAFAVVVAVNLVLMYVGPFRRA